MSAQLHSVFDNEFRIVEQPLCAALTGWAVRECVRVCGAARMAARGDRGQAGGRHQDCTEGEGVAGNVPHADQRRRPPRLLQGAPAPPRSHACTACMAACSPYCCILTKASELCCPHLHCHV